MRALLIICMLFVGLFCYLGTWQVHRYSAKKNLLSAYALGKSTPPAAFSDIKDYKPFQSVRVQGDALNEMTLLIQNRFYQHQTGYEILTPIRLKQDKKLLLIDRGWVPKPKQGLPVFPPLKSHETITGHLKMLNESQFILGKNSLDLNARPLIIQKIDTLELERITGHAFYPFILRMNTPQTEGFVRDWVITSVPPERHLSYAVQWFALALITLIGFLVFYFKRKAVRHAK